MKDVPKASSRATVPFSEVIVRQQVVTAPSPGAVGVTGMSAVAVTRWQSLVHPGGDLQWRVCSRSL